MFVKVMMTMVMAIVVTKDDDDDDDGCGQWCVVLVPGGDSL